MLRKRSNTGSRWTVFQKVTIKDLNCQVYMSTLLLFNTSDEMYVTGHQRK